ncbi:MAG: hypothetical protein GXP44_01345 [bacterium]|nr:hypothetical protein [bacterium]
MNNKTIIILSVAIVLILAIGAILLFLPGAPSEGTADNGGGSFPVGGERDINGLPGAEGLPLEASGEAADFTQIVSDAVAGAGVFKSESTSTIRYIEKSTGHIYEVGPTGKNRERVTNTTILKVFESLWSPIGDKVVVRYLEDEGAVPSAKIFSAAINAVSNSLEGVFLPETATSAAVSPEGDEIFYLNEKNGATVGVVADFENKNKDVIFSTPFGEFTAGWPSANIISLLTKPSAFAEGYLYFLSPKTGKLKKIIGGAKGLDASVSPDGKTVLYSQSAKKGLIVKILDRETAGATDFPLKTLPEKCVWSGDSETVYCGVPDSLPPANYPDAWYQGTISFNDALWKENISTGETTLIMDDTGADITNLFLGPDGNYLIFTDKKDNTLWSVNIGD